MAFISDTQVVSIFRALGEPTRFEMIDRLAKGTPHTLTSLSRGLHITRQGARKHLQILADANLVKLFQHGRTTTVELDRHTLDKGKQFIAKLEQQWDKRLHALKHFVEHKK